MEGQSSTDLADRAAAAYLSVDADPVGFAPYASALVEEARRAGQHGALVAALRAEAWAHRGRQDNARAKALLNDAAGLARRHRLLDHLGEVLLTRAAVNLELGLVQAAQRDLDASLPLVRGVAVAQRDLFQGVLHHNLGQLSAAAATYRAVLNRPTAPLLVRGKAANNLAHIEAQHGSYRAALRTLEVAAEAAPAMNPVMVAGVRLTRGWVSVQAGMLPQGLRFINEAKALFESAGLPLGELYAESADAFTDLRLMPEARAATSRAVEEFRVHDLGLMRADAQWRAARLALRSGDVDEAYELAEAAAALFGRQRRPAWAARASLVAMEARLDRGDAGPDELRRARRVAVRLERLGIRQEAVHAHLVAGRLAAVLGRDAAALRSLDHAHRLARRTPVLVRLDGRVAAAAAAQVRGHEAEVLRQCRRGLRDLALHRAALPSMELRALASGHGTDLGRMGLEVSLRSGSPARVLDWMERTRAAALSCVGSATAPAASEAMAALRAVNAELAEAETADHVTLAGVLVARQRELENSIRRSGWVGEEGATANEPAVGPAQLGSALRDSVLVEYGVSRGSLFAVVLEARRSRLVALGPVEAVETQTRSLLFALRRLTHPRSGPGQSAARASADFALARLTALLLVPLELAPDVPLVVVPLRALHRLPWAALHDGAVSLAPSASFWLRTWASTPTPDAPTVLAAGPDLPGAVSEVSAVRRLYPAATVLLPPASTAAAVAGALVGAELAHLACHGNLRADNPMFSALWMSDGPLSLAELDHLGATPRRIVLASCESGAQVTYAGDEVVGFVSTLLAQGTAGLLASTVIVSDGATEQLMCRVHEELQRGHTLANALHEARLEVDRADPRAFVTWCAFNAYGAA